MEVLHSVKDFIHSKQFWMWHGFVLSGLWILGSAFGILAKKFSTVLHLLTFVIINFTTLFFAGSALYRVATGVSNFMDWSLLKQAHVCAGALFLILIIIQHIGGLTAFLGQKPNPQHRSFGKIVSIIGRAIACVGWVLGGNLQYAIICAVVSTVIILAALALDGGSGSSKKSTKASTDQNQRSKSPRAKRQ